MPRLVYTDQDGTRQVLGLSEARPSVVVGRHPDCDLITTDSSVSRRHCMVARSADADVYHVRDLGSANGTTLNNDPITERPLAHGDVIKCGSLVLQFVNGEGLVGELELEFFPPPGVACLTDDLPPPTSMEMPTAPGQRLQDLEAFNAQQAKSLAILQDQLADTTQALEASKAEAEALKLEVERRETRLDALSMENVDMQAEVGGLREELRQAAAERDALAGARAKSAQHVTSATQELEVLRGQIGTLEIAAAEREEAERRQLPAHARELDALKVKVMTLESALSKQRDHAEAAREAGARHASRLTGLEAELDAVRRARAEAADRIESLEAALEKAERDQGGAGVEALEARVVELEAALKVARRGEAEARAALDEARAAGSVAAKARREKRVAEAALEKAQARIAALEAELPELELDGADLEEIDD